ncbi:MAG: PadR family transcriptional regulator [Geminicoccaceae bacterium]
MDVKTLCLGVLSFGDRTGYEIKQCFEDTFHHFYLAGFSSIYPALADLARQGLVTVEVVEQDGRPTKKIYSLTEAGHEALTGELQTAEPRHRLRSEFLALMYFAHLLPPARVAEVIDQVIAQFEDSLASVQRCTQDRAPDDDMTPGMRFAAEYGLTMLGTGLGFLKANRDRLIDALQHDAARRRYGDSDRIVEAAE